MSVAMARRIIIPPMLLPLIFLLTHVATSSSAGERRPYIIHMDKSAIPTPFANHDSWYRSTISSISVADGMDAVHLYTYNHVMNGFSAVMSQAQLNELERMPGHLATYPETYAQPQITHAPQFLGLSRHVGLWPTANFGDDVIIGILDSGIWPESEMFSDEGMPPVPERWRGACETGDKFNSSNCNRKIIGARSFSKGLKEAGLNISKIDDYDSPRDYDGHGTHTASTAAGSRTPNVDYFGYAKGTAVGIAPMARLAIYKVTFSTITTSAIDFLAGMDQAIADGVDLMSFSWGLLPVMPYDENNIAVGAFAAMEKGIFVSCPAGNTGPDSFTIVNGAPWITTVAAGTIDREYTASITLGDGITTVQGKSIYPEDIYISRVPLYYGHGNASKEICDNDALDQKDVGGKIVFCAPGNLTSQVLALNRTNAKGAILATDLAQPVWPEFFFMPFVMIGFKDGEIMKRYITKSAQPPTVDIKFQTTVLGWKPAPQVAKFSSRGPNRASPSILKPDIVAPGVNILAAWVPNRGFQQIRNDYMMSEYRLLSGTSMSTPHIGGVAALLRAAHRDWSPAAIRSAIMTTAYITDNTHGPILDMTNGTAATPLDYGAGHVDPNKAMDPGLVYDLDRQDYINFLCGLNYTSKQMKILTRGSNYTCSKATLDLNYPSFMVILNNTNSSSVVFKRILTNVADSPSVYRAVLKVPNGMKVVVDPPELKFDGKYSKQGFTMNVQIDMAAVMVKSVYTATYGYLSWYEDGGNHAVRTPIVSAFVP